MEPKRRIIPIFVPHVGCPNDCVFCNQRKISGTLVPASAESTAREIISALARIPADTPAELAFYGGSFTAIPLSEQLALLDAVSPFLLSGRIDRIRVSTRPDCVRKEDLLLLKERGVRTVELGAQSMDEGVLRLSGRGHTAEDTVKAAATVRECGLSLMLQMMTGLPGDTPGKSIETAKRIAALSPDGVRIYPTVIIRETKLYEMWLAGSYKEHTVEDAVSVCAEIAEIFKEKNIPIIRLGLNPTDDLSSGEAVAGAYHPALGELVYSRMYFNRAVKLLGDEKREGEIIMLGVAKGRAPLMIGQKRENMVKLREKYGFSTVKIRETAVNDGEIILL